METCSQQPFLVKGQEASSTCGFNSQEVRKLVAQEQSEPFTHLTNSDGDLAKENSRARTPTASSSLHPSRMVRRHLHVATKRIGAVPLTCELRAYVQAETDGLSLVQPAF